MSSDLFPQYELNFEVQGVPSTIYQTSQAALDLRLVGNGKPGILNFVVNADTPLDEGSYLVTVETSQANVATVGLDVLTGPNYHTKLDVAQLAMQAKLQPRFIESRRLVITHHAKSSPESPEYPEIKFEASDQLVMDNFYCWQWPMAGTRAIDFYVVGDLVAFADDPNLRIEWGGVSGQDRMAITTPTLVHGIGAFFGGVVTHFYEGATFPGVPIQPPEVAGTIVVFRSSEDGTMHIYAFSSLGKWYRIKLGVWG